MALDIHVLEAVSALSNDLTLITDTDYYPLPGTDTQPIQLSDSVFEVEVWDGLGYQDFFSGLTYNEALIKSVQLQQQGYETLVTCSAA